MKKLSILPFLIPNLILAQIVATSLGVQDTRNINNPPLDYKQEIRIEFKDRNVIGVPGTGFFSGNLTIAPWTDGSGNKNHQLNFNDGGIFHRSGVPEGQWEEWKQLMTINPDGNLGIIKSDNHTIRSYSPTLFLDRDTNIGGYIQGIQTRLQDGTNNWFFGNLQADNFIIKAGAFDSPKLFTINRNGHASLEGKLEAKEVKVTLTPTADFVFEEDYNLPKLEEVEKYIKDKKHLPEITSAKEMEKEGVNIGEFQIKLLQKIEELTLYSIEQNKQMKEQAERIKKLEEQLSIKK